MPLGVIVAVEGGLGVLALVVGWLLGVPVLRGLYWGPRALALGAIATAPLFLGFLLLWQLPLASLQEIRQRVESLVGELFPPQTPLSYLALVSAAAGFGEELLFRGLIQGGLTPVVGVQAAILTAAVLFGLAHPVTRAYVVLAALIGAYLSWLWLVSGNLLVPVVTHAAYDFCALSFVCARRSRGRNLTPTRDA